MNNLRLFLDNLWRWKCNLPDITSSDIIPYGSIKSFEQLKEMSVPDFLVKVTNEINQLADNRMIMGTFRYGPKTKDNIGKYNYREFLQKRLNLYLETNNMEYLVDIYNGIRLEWLEALNKGYSMKSIDDGEHATKIK